jgi:hypothetical protein
VSVTHVGQGVVIRDDHIQSLSAAFGDVFPWTYGSREVNSKDPRSLKHREAYDLLVSCVWPANTDTKFFGLEGFPHRSGFHRTRFDVCLGSFVFMLFPLSALSPTHSNNLRLSGRK